MVLPSSGSMTIAQVEAEFGLPAGSVWPNAFWGKGGAPASGPLILPNDFYGRSNVAVVIPAGGYEDYCIQPVNASCSITFKADGTWLVDNANVSDLSGTWRNQAGSYWIRWTNTSGTLSSGTAGTWQALTIDRTFAVIFTSNSGGGKNCTGNVQIATDSAGTNIIASGSIGLSAVVDV